MKRLRHLISALELKTTAKWFLLSGIVAGLGAIGFQLATNFVLHYMFSSTSGYVLVETAGERNIFADELSSTINND